MATNLQFIKSASGTSVSSLSVTDCFSANYDVYKITGLFTVSVSGYHNFRLIYSGGTDSSSTYDNAFLMMKMYDSFIEERQTGQNAINRSQYFGTQQDFVMYVFNPNDSSSYTFFTNQGGGTLGSSTNLGAKFIGVHKEAQQNTGLEFSTSSGTVTGKINVYGVKG